MGDALCVRTLGLMEDSSDTRESAGAVIRGRLSYRDGWAGIGVSAHRVEDFFGLRSFINRFQRVGCISGTDPMQMLYVRVICKFVGVVSGPPSGFVRSNWSEVLCASPSGEERIPV